MSTTQYEPKGTSHCCTVKETHVILLKNTEATKIIFNDNNNEKNATGIACIVDSKAYGSD